MSQLSARQQSFPPASVELAQYMPSPRLVTALIVSALQSKFSRLENLVFPALRHERFLWVPDRDERLEMPAPLAPSIYLGEPFDLRPERAFPAPAIVVSRSSLTLAPPMSIGDKFQMGRPRIGELDAQHNGTLGFVNQQFTVQGTHNVMCVADSPGLTDVLACEVFDFLVDHQRVIRKEAGFNEVRVEGLGPVAPVEGYNPTCWAAPIGVRYTYTRASVLRDGSPILKAVDARPSDPDSPLLRQ